MVKFLRQHRTNDVPVTGTISPRYIHQFSHKSIRVTAKGSAVLPSRKSAEPFSSYKVIFQHPQAIRAIRHIRIARTPRLLSSCYQTGNPVLKKCVFSRFCSPLHPLFHYSHSTNPIIWGCISYTFTGITFANLLIFYLLFLAANFLSIKIVSQKAGEYNYLLHRFPGYSAIENTLIYRKFSFIALDAFRSGRSRHPWTL